MCSYVALYRGATIGEAKMVAVSVDPDLVAQVVNRLLQDEEKREQPLDPAVKALQDGRRHALRLIHSESLPR